MPVFKNFKNSLFLLLFLFFIIESKLEIEEVYLKNEITINDLTETKYFHIIPSFDNNNLPNYLKIELSLLDSHRITEDDIVISYYAQDSHFINRKQLSRNSTVVWLNKEQLKKDFYFSVESLYSETAYDLNIYLKDIILLELDQQYIYYVSEENKEMSFRLCGDIGWAEEGKDGILSIWAKGDNDILTELNESNYYKHPKYSAYLVKIKNKIFYEYNLKVEGIPGDIINVGHKFFYKNSNTTEIEFNIESYGILKKNLFEKVCYRADFTSHYFYLFIHDKQELYKLAPEKSDGEEDDEDEDDYFGNKKYCLYFNETFGLNEYFYSVQALKKFDVFEKGEIYPPQLLGINYERDLKEKSIIGIIPKNTKDDFNYITYHIQEIKGLIKASMTICNFYPFCQINSLKNEILINNFNSYSYSFTLDEYGKNIIPFNQKQNVLLISCEKGLWEDYENICTFNINIFTDKNKINIQPKTPLYQYIREKNEISLLINHSTLNSISDKLGNLHIYLNIEIISGDSIISFSYKDIIPYKYKNKIFYSFDYNKSEEYILNIKANINTVCSINLNYIEKINKDEKIYSMLIPEGIDYLFKFDKGNNYYNIIFSNCIKKYDSTNKEPSYYFGFYSINCKINIQQVNSNNNLILEENNNYQEIIKYSENASDIIYNVTKDDIESKNCTFEIDSFLFDDEYNMEYINGIILPIDIPKIFFFNKDNSILKFLYIHTDKEKELKINIKLLNDEKYKVNLFYNNDNINKDYFLTKSDTIFIKSKDLYYKCMNYNQICKINFLVESQKLQSNSKIEILISYSDNDSNDNNNNSNNSISKILFISIVSILSIILLIALVILVIIIFKCKNKGKNKSFNEEINNLTYLNDIKNDH